MTLSQEQRSRVLDGAMTLFSTTPLRDMTLDSLAHTSGISAFDILRTFQSRENILTAVLERELEQMAAAAQALELRWPGETLKDELHVLADVILDGYRRRMPFLRRLLAAALQDEEVGALFYRTFIMQGRRLFTEFLSQRSAAGELRSGLDIEAAAAIFLASLTGALWTSELFGGSLVEPLDDRRLVSEISNVFIEGVKHH